MISTNNQQISLSTSSIESPTEKEGLLCPIGQVFMRYPVKTPCNHIFEEICINDWLGREPSCPMDRRRVTKEELVLQQDLQAKIQDYLTLHPEEDDNDAYQELIEQYSAFWSKKEESEAGGSQAIEQQGWRHALPPTNFVALCCILL